MKKSLWVVMLLAIFIAFSSTNCDRVEAGTVGLKIYTLGSDKGDIDLLGLGYHWIGWNEELVIFPTNIQNYEWTADKGRMSENNEEIEFQSSEGLRVTADISISFQFERDKVPSIYKKYRKGVEELIDIEIKNETQKWMTRFAGARTAEELYGKGKTKLIKDVKGKISEKYEKEGIIIKRLAWIGAIRLPQRNKDGNFKRFTKKIMCVETGQIFDSVKDAAEFLKVKPATISKHRYSKKNRAAGFTWKLISNQKG